MARGPHGQWATWPVGQRTPCQRTRGQRPTRPGGAIKHHYLRLNCVDACLQHLSALLQHVPRLVKERTDFDKFSHQTLQGDVEGCHLSVLTAGLRSPASMKAVRGRGELGGVGSDLFIVSENECYARAYMPRIESVLRHTSCVHTLTHVWASSCRRCNSSVIELTLPR